MKTLRIVMLLALIAIVPTLAHAGYPMISSIPNQYLSPNESTPVISFHVTDDMTSVDDIVLTYSSNNTALVPDDDDHITLGGSGAVRTVQVTPVGGHVGTGTGVATITITATDTDGDSSQEWFTIEIRQAPKI